MSNARRTGATRRADISPDLLAQLNAGTQETATLAEGLAIDFEQLLRAIAPDVAAERIDPHHGITRRMQLAGELLLEQYGETAITRFAHHPADTVRGWAAYMITAAPHQSLATRLTQMRPLADDPHFAVREWAWLAIRPHLAAELDLALTLLTPWSHDPAENIRRFASESTRPRGVWCAHIPELKAHPEKGLPLLTPLQADPSRYVQDSVANWLNDAAKTQPTWVQDLCVAWHAVNNSPATTRICTRALRNQKRA